MTDSHSERNIFENAHMTEQGIVLKNETDLPVARRLMRHIFVLVQHGSGIGRFEPGNDSQQSCFPGTGWSEKCEQ